MLTTNMSFSETVYDDIRFHGSLYMNMIFSLKKCFFLFLPDSTHNHLFAIQTIE